MRLPTWKRKPMVGEAVLETREAAREASQRDVFLRLIEQSEPALRWLASCYLEEPARLKPTAEK